MNKMTYRYYLKETSLDAQRTVKRLIESGRIKTHEIVTIRGNYSVKRSYRLTIRTHTEQFQFRGFSWFYYGSGTLAMRQLLKWLLVPQEYQDAVLEIAHGGDNYDPNCFIIAPMKGVSV